ncbi:MAG: hypothetical protein M3417_11645 [Actinomycetota bacterium]|nr:hypothetical protein [Actinomycetota bacterium]
MPGVPSRWRASPARLVRLLAGLLLFGAGEGLLVHSALGNSPWTVLAEGVAEQAGLAIGTTTVAISFLILVAWVPLRQRPGLGTIANAVVVGVAIDLTLRVLGDGSGALAARALEVVGAIALVSVGSGFYLTARLGPGPRDGLMTGLAARTGGSIRLTRSLIELSVCAAGVALGGTLGLGTLAFALLIGPGVQFALARLGALGVADL